jgi:DNA-binding winged helix-turn-helix (wHTH) protein
MKKLLIFTHSPNSENKFLIELQSIGFEVFGMKNFFLVEKANILKLCDYFDGIIFSHSITNLEAMKLEKILEPLENRISFFRMVMNEHAINKKQSNYTYLYDEDTIDELRDKIDNRLSKNDINIRLQSQKIKRIIRLTGHQEMLISLLEDAQGEFVSREKICSTLWNEPASNSRFSQISILISSIKNKLKQNGVNDDLIATKWGSGYKIDIDVLNKI